MLSFVRLSKQAQLYLASLCNTVKKWQEVILLSLTLSHMFHIYKSKNQVCYRDCNFLVPHVEPAVPYIQKQETSVAFCEFAIAESVTSWEPL